MSSGESLLISQNIEIHHQHQFPSPLLKLSKIESFRKGTESVVLPLEQVSPTDPLFWTYEHNIERRLTMKSLSDKVAIFTGSAREIGEKIAERLAREGANLALCDVNQEALQETAKRLETEFQVKVFCSVCDVSDETQVKTFIADVITAMGKIDILVNNAGITRDNLLMRMTESDWDKVIQINLRSVFLSRDSSSSNAQERSGRIISILPFSIWKCGQPTMRQQAESSAFFQVIGKEVGIVNP